MRSTFGIFITCAGNPAPEHLDGTLAGDFGFDPLGLASEPELKKW
jgi:hypothetical protein